MRDIITCVQIIRPTMWHSDEISDDKSFIREDQNNIEQGMRKVNL